MAGSCEHGEVPWASTNGKGIFDKFNDYSFHKKDFADGGS
jgi:hypothetical protein